jgi:hypothetical protein
MSIRTASTTFVIEGQLFVESGGVTLEAQTGDVVQVPAGAAGRYWAPKYARLLAIYGPSEGRPQQSFRLRKSEQPPGVVAQPAGDLANDHIAYD